MGAPQSVRVRETLSFIASFSPYVVLWTLWHLNSAIRLVSGCRQRCAVLDLDYNPHLGLGCLITRS